MNINSLKFLNYLISIKFTENDWFLFISKTTSKNLKAFSH